MNNEEASSHSPLHHPAEEVERGMTVEANAGDLGEEDVSRPRVKEVQRDAVGAVKAIVITKGHLFKKTLKVPANRVQKVEAASEDVPSTSTYSKRSEDDKRSEKQTSQTQKSGKVTIQTTQPEIKALSAQGTETLADRAAANTPHPDNILGQTEEHLPTTEGLRRREARKEARQVISTTKPQSHPKRRSAHTTDDNNNVSTSHFSLRDLGPGLLAGMAGNDSSAVTSYSVNGATNGYGQLWLMVLATPLYQAVQYTCAKLGRITQHGLAEILREHYGRKVAIPASLILILANTALIAADLVAIGTGLQLFTGLAWQWFVVPIAVLLWYLTVYQSFGTIKKIFLGLSLIFVAYLITGLFSGANWGLVLKDTFVPQINFTFASISSAVALLGATVSPYTMYWQVQGEKEERRPGPPRRQLKEAALDIATGTLGGNLVAYAIILCTSATLFSHHQTIRTAADAAQALQPLLGPYAKYLFAVGFIGAGLVAIPVLLASTSYAVAGTFGWPASLSKKPWQNEGFYLILTGALAASLLLAFLGLDPIHLMFGANVLQGILSPVLVVLLLLVGNNRKIMRTDRLGRWTNSGLMVIALMMSAAAILLFYGLLTGQGG